MKRIELTKNKKSIIIYSSYDKILITNIKQIDTRSYNPNDKTWKIHLNLHTVGKIIDLILQFDFDTDDNTLNQIDLLVKQLKEKQELYKQNLIDSKSIYSDIEVKGLKKKLRDFQKSAVKYSIKNKKILLGDEMGCGKTIESIAIVEYEQSYPTLVICPNTLKYNWKKEYNDWIDEEVQILNTQDNIQEYQQSNITIINYNTAKKFLPELKKLNFKSIIIDESHYLKNAKTQRTKAIKELTKKVERILLLSGTAVVNRPNELISQLQILGFLNEFGGWWGFAKRYCDAKKGHFGFNIGGASNTEELHIRLRQTCYIRRNKKDVLKELPSKQRIVLSLDIDNRREYKKAEDDIVNYLKEESIKDIEFNQSLKGLNKKEKEEKKKQRKEDVGRKAAAAKHLVQINSLKQLSVKGKLKEIIEWITNFLESNEKLVIACTHKNTINKISNYFKCNKIDGSVSIENRQLFIDRFQEDKNEKLIAVNIQTGGVGITLTASQNIVIVEQGWTPGEHSQLEDRLHRIGQTNTVTIYYMIGRETIDEDIYTLIEEKRKITDNVNAGEKSTVQVSIMKELLNRLKSKSSNS